MRTADEHSAAAKAPACKTEVRLATRLALTEIVLRCLVGDEARPNIRDLQSECGQDL